MRGEDVKPEVGKNVVVMAALDGPSGVLNVAV